MHIFQNIGKATKVRFKPLNLTVLEQIRTTWINLYFCERNYVIEWKKINRKNENEYIN